MAEDTISWITTASCKPADNTDVWFTKPDSSQVAGTYVKSRGGFVDDKDVAVSYCPSMWRYRSPIE